MDSSRKTVTTQILVSSQTHFLGNYLTVLSGRIDSLVVFNVAVSAVII